MYILEWKILSFSGRFKNFSALFFFYFSAVDGSGYFRMFASSLRARRFHRSLPQGLAEARDFSNCSLSSLLVVPKGDPQVLRYTLGYACWSKAISGPRFEY